MGDHPIGTLRAVQRPCASRQCRQKDTDPPQLVKPIVLTGIGQDPMNVIEVFFTSAQVRLLQAKALYSMMLRGCRPAEKQTLEIRILSHPGKVIVQQFGGDAAIVDVRIVARPVPMPASRTDHVAIAAPKYTFSLAVEVDNLSFYDNPNLHIVMIVRRASHAYEVTLCRNRRVSDQEQLRIGQMKLLQFRHIRKA
jgi:hypothetical protein